MREFPLTLSDNSLETPHPHFPLTPISLVAEQRKIISQSTRIKLFWSAPELIGDEATTEASSNQLPTEALRFPSADQQQAGRGWRSSSGSWGCPCRSPWPWVPLCSPKAAQPAPLHLPALIKLSPSSCCSSQQTFIICTGTEEAISRSVLLIISSQLVRSAFANISRKAFLFVMHKEQRTANKINCCHGNIMPQQVKNSVSWH